MPNHIDVFATHESEVRSYCRDFPVVFERAAGAHLWDTGGRRYVDLLLAAGSLNYGHNPEPVVHAVVDYLHSGGPVQTLDLHTTAKQTFLRRLHDEVLQPHGLGDFVVQFPGPAGTLAVEAALKLARKVTGRTRVLALGGGFHGASLGSLAATSSPLLRGAAGVALPGVQIVPYGDVDEAVTLDAIARAIRPTLQTEPPAAIIVETVQGEGGLTVASPSFLRQVRQLADEAQSLVIVDDIQAGCGRTGTFFSFTGIPGFSPDLVCLSKSLSGMGLPMAAVLIRRDLDAWAPGEHNGTFRGQNLAFVAGAAAFDYWADQAFVENLRALQTSVVRDLVGLADTLPGQVEVVGRGCMSGLRFADGTVAERVRAGLFAEGIVAETCGAGQVLKLLPALTMPLEQWSDVFDTLDSTVTRTVRSVARRTLPVPAEAAA